MFVKASSVLCVWWSCETPFFCELLSGLSHGTTCGVSMFGKGFETALKRRQSLCEVGVCLEALRCLFRLTVVDGQTTYRVPSNWTVFSAICCSTVAL